MNVVHKPPKKSLNDSDFDSKKTFSAIPIPIPTSKNFIFTTPTESQSESGFGLRS